ncbi:MAG: metallophosphoesterase [Defluviitaleaceae bacterium]|nr:metallophosphoesterase [Defluviitaleaceae bacterium]
MAEFNIIHLADLHIKNSTGKDYNVAKEFAIIRNLIIDINARTKTMQNVIIVITGDIVDKADFGDLNDVENNPTLLFFKNLFSIFMSRDAKSRLIDIQICPGNHEKVISSNSEIEKFEELKEFSIALQDYSYIKASGDEEKTDKNKKALGGEDFDNVAYWEKIKPGNKEHWDKIKPSFQDYITLVNKIYDIFKQICKEDKKPIEDSCNVDFKTIKSEFYTSNNEKEERSDLVLGFINLNTSFVAAGKLEDVERRRLLIGVDQRVRLRNEYLKSVKEIIENDEDITEEDFVTFCLSHYPLDFLQFMDEEDIKKDLLSKSGFNAEFFFHGHTHERKIVSFSKKTRKVICLETGIGAYPKKDRDNDQSAYSIYTFNRSKNIYSVSMYKSNTEADGFTVDAGFMGDNTNRIVYPWIVEGQPFIQPKVQNEDSILRDFYVDHDVLFKLKETAECQVAFKEGCKKSLQKMLLIGKLHKYLKILKSAELSPSGKEKFRNHNLAAIVATSFDETPLINNHTPKDIVHIREVILKLIEKFTSFSDEINCEYTDNSIFFPELDKLYVDETLNIHFNDTSGDKRRNEFYNDFKCEDFISYLELISSAFLKSFGLIFKDDTVRVIIRAHKNANINNSYPSKDCCYLPIIRSENHINQNPSNRCYEWKDDKDNLLITAEAFNEGNPIPRIFSLNKSLVGFGVENWTDFIVITPGVFNHNINQRRNGLRPVFSIVISVKLSEIIGEKTAETKKRFKQLSNKLYLLSHMDIQKTFDDVIKDFVNVYKITPEEFISYLNKKNKYMLPNN